VSGSNAIAKAILFRGLRAAQAGNGYEIKELLWSVNNPAFFFRTRHLPSSEGLGVGYLLSFRSKKAIIRKSGIRANDFYITGIMCCLQNYPPLNPLQGGEALM